MWTAKDEVTLQRLLKKKKEHQDCLNHQPFDHHALQDTREQLALCATLKSKILQLLQYVSYNEMTIRAIIQDHDAFWLNPITSEEKVTYTLINMLYDKELTYDETTKLYSRV